MDEYGCLRRGNKAILVHKLGVKHHKLHALTASSWTPSSSCITWSGPVGKCRCSGGVTESAACIVCCYREISHFDRYTDLSAKDHERQRRAGAGSSTLNPDLNSPLPSREAMITSVGCHV